MKKFIIIGSAVIAAVTTAVVGSVVFADVALFDMSVAVPHDARTSTQISVTIVIKIEFFILFHFLLLLLNIQRIVFPLHNHYITILHFVNKDL